MCTKLTPPSGYRPCACRDCMEVAIGEPGAFCSGCADAGCPDYQGQPGMSQECQRPDAYGEDEAFPTEIHAACAAKGFYVITDHTAHPAQIVGRLLATLLILAPDLDAAVITDAVRPALNPEALADERHPIWATETAQKALDLLMALLNAHGPKGFAVMPDGNWSRLGFFPR